MDDRYPFSLKTLVGVPCFVYSNSYMSKIDDKSGYDHILLSCDLQQNFGIEWQGWWLVKVTLPFGWKNSPFVYWSLGVACTLNIDDRLNGELFSSEGFWHTPTFTENSYIQLPVGGGGFVHSLYSSCELGLFSGHLQVRSCPCNPDPIFGIDCGLYCPGLSHTRRQED